MKPNKSPRGQRFPKPQVAGSSPAGCVAQKPLIVGLESTRAAPLHSGASCHNPFVFEVCSPSVGTHLVTHPRRRVVGVWR